MPVCMPQLQSIFLPLRLAHHQLSQFHCREALQALGTLPASQRCSAGVLLLIGRCLYELVDYARAAEAFEAARSADPLNLEVRHTGEALGSLRAGKVEFLSFCGIVERSGLQLSSSAISQRGCLSTPSAACGGHEFPHAPSTVHVLDICQRLLVALSWLCRVVQHARSAFFLSSSL